MRFSTALAGLALVTAPPAMGQTITLSAEAEVSLNESIRCAEIANQAGSPPSGAALAQVNTCLTNFLRNIERLPPEDQYHLASIAFTQFPCFGFGPQKDLIVQSSVRAARALGDFDAAIIALFNRGVCYWNDEPANFERALQNFAPFRDALAPYVNPRWLDSADAIRQQAFVFREAARRYIRFLENAYRVDLARRGTLCGGQANHCLNDAWILTQRVKARLFHSRMMQVFAGNDRSGALADLLGRQYSLTQTREALRLGLPSAAGETRQSVASETARVDAELARQFPEYFSLHQNFAPTLDELRGSLRDNEVYISYLFTDDLRRVVAFRVTRRDPPRLILLPVLATELKDRVAVLNSAIVELASSAELEPMLRQAGTDLLERLDIPAGARVIIEADEELSAMPFALLIGRNGPLGAGREITYVPSAGVFRNLRSDAGRARGDLYFGFGRMSFPTLPPPNNFLGAIRQEIAAAAAAFGSNALINEPEARESLLYRQGDALARARVLHLASHTEVRAGEVALMFHEGDGEDGRLTETDIIARLRTSADLVVLSGCDTATLNQSGDVPGEAFSALTRAFFATGARKLLVTQWQVRDRFAGPFIETFMRGYAEHSDVARALAEAQTAVRALPEATERDWAGWILVGD
jgi:hypothetical protein